MNAKAVGDHSSDLNTLKKAVGDHSDIRTVQRLLVSPVTVGQ